MSKTRIIIKIKHLAVLDQFQVDVIRVENSLFANYSLSLLSKQL